MTVADKQENHTFSEDSPEGKRLLEALKKNPARPLSIVKGSPRKKLTKKEREALRKTLENNETVHSPRG